MTMILDCEKLNAQYQNSVLTMPWIARNRPWLRACLSCFAPARSAESEALGGPAVGERCKLPSGVPSRQEFWCFFVEQSFTVNVKNHNVYALYSNWLLVFSEVSLLFSCLMFLWPGSGAPRSSGAPVHWTAWTPGSYATEHVTSS